MPANASTPDSKAATSATLSGGLKVSQVQEVANSSDKSMRDVTVRVCGAPTTGDSLKSEANKIAKALKSVGDAKTIATIHVTNTSGSGDSARVRCEDFQMNTFDGAAGVETATWKTADES